MQRKTICAGLGAIALLMSSGSIEPVQAQSATACDAYARDYARNASRQGQMLGRGALGAGLGAGIGAAFSGVAAGAAIGGALGVISGGSKRQRTADRMYRAAYQDCMAGRIR